MDLHDQIYNLRKDNMIVSQYMMTVKTFFSYFNYVSEPMSESDLIHYDLKGLVPCYFL